MSKSGSKIREQVAHFLVDIHTERWKFTDSQSYTEEDLSHSFYFC